MMAVPKDLFAQALNMQYAIGAFNTSNLEMAQAIVQAAEAKRAPVIMQTSEGAISYAGLNVIMAIMKALAEAAKVPVIIHLDHGKSLDIVKQCIDVGYTSVMFDASKESLEDNIRATREVVEYAHNRGVWVEAELGAILGAEGAKELEGESTPDEFLTRPQDAERFVLETKCDSLAVSVGTIHGAFSGQEFLRFELLEKVAKAVPDTPLVLHGASGLADEHLAEAALTNVCKVNVDTELRIAFEAAVKAYFDDEHDSVDPRKILGPAREAAQSVIEKKIEIFNGTGKADMVR